jgi:hypothetical protein
MMYASIRSRPLAVKRSFFRAAAAIVTAALITSMLSAQSSGGVLARHYHDGDSLHYQMEATNQNHERVTRYAARADGVTHRDSAGRFVEDFEWSRLVRDGRELALPTGTAGVRQRLTLAPEFMLQPNAASTSPALIGPVLDFFTFYVDLWISAKMPLVRAGDHARIPGKSSTSWADGKDLVIAEDAVDLDITLGTVDSAAHVAHLAVRHVPTSNLLIRLPSEWMRVPLGDAPNNWVEVTHGANGAYVAAVGRETFDVQLVVSLVDGRIVSATMENPVDVLERTCSDAALTSCGDAARYRILRRIALR